MMDIFANRILFGEELLNSVHIFSGEWLDYSMLVITASGSELFYTIMLPILYWCWDKKKALTISCIFIVSLACNDILKNIFDHPRPDPSHMLPGLKELAIKSMPKDPGFPSGHAQGAVSFWGGLFLGGATKTMLVLSITMIVLICYSRLYLGVHFLGDILGGLFFGIICIAIIVPSARFAENYIGSANAFLLLSAIIIIPVLVYNIVPGTRINSNMGILSGYCAGAFLSRSRFTFNPQNRPRFQLAKSAIGIVGLMLIRFGLKRLLPENPNAGFIHYWFMGLWCTYAAPLIFSKINALRGQATE